MYWKSILIGAIMSEYKDYDKLKLQLRRFYYLYWVAGKTLSQIKQTSFNLIKWVKEHRDIEEIAKELNDKLESDKILDLASRNLSSEHIASEPWIKPLLILMEYNVTDESHSSFIELNYDLHLEHILPIKYEKFNEWSHISKEFAPKWINSAGNLTLLSGSKNIEASNNPFDIKIEVYRGKGKYDHKNDKITGFKITQSILLDFDKSTYDKLWNEKSIHDRWEWFFGEVEQLFEVDLNHVKKLHQTLVV